MNTVLRKGTVIGGFTIGKVLGHGGFGITYLAQEKTTGKIFALKEYFPKEFALRQSNGIVKPKPSDVKIFKLGLASFVSEARILQTLPRQKGLVQVRGAFERSGTAYCIMEYIEGDPLDLMIPRVIERNGAVPEALIEQFVLSVCPALAAVHSKKLIHRDVKPGNVMIKRDGQPVLIDFGAARSYRRNANKTVVFTRKYAAIEQFPQDWTNLKPALKEGPWSDLFSLSVMLYEMVSRRAPPDAYKRLTAIQKTGKDPYVNVAQMIAQSQVKEQYSQNLTDLIDFGCKLFPKDRPANAINYQRVLTSRGSKSKTRIPRQEQSSYADKTKVVENGKPQKPNPEKPGEMQIKTPPKDITLLILIALVALAVVIFSLWGVETREVF